MSILAVAALTGCPPEFWASPTAFFTAVSSGNPALVQVDFTDASNAGAFPITAWAWDFGDGATSTEQHPTHTYAAPGSYTASLTVTTTLGSSTYTRSVGAIPVWYVKTGGSGDGSSWDNALGTIQDGVDAASAAGGGAVLVAAGTYTAASPGDENVVVMAQSVHLYGGYAGAAAKRNDRDWEKQPIHHRR